MKYIFTLISILFLLWPKYQNLKNLDGNDSVYDVLRKLGEEEYLHIVNVDISGVSVEKGKQLVHDGFTYDINGNKTKKQSKYFNCIACHNTTRVDPDLANPNPEERLKYAIKNDIPFLQGSPFYGIVNRTSYYNDDYYKKYGDLVFNAREDLRNAIQLCATECAQGRALENWEIESILSYFWTLQLKMKDLNLYKSELGVINDRLSKKEKDLQMRDFIKSKYAQKMAATFVTPLVEREKRYEFDGNRTNGARIYEKSCQHCHFDNLYSFRILDKKKSTFKYLDKDLKDYTKKSVYEVVRWGTEPLIGKKAYMPHYPLEKLSEKQVKDLVTYIHYEAN